MLTQSLDRYAVERDGHGLLIGAKSSQPLARPQGRDLFDFPLQLAQFLEGGAKPAGRVGNDRCEEAGSGAVTKKLRGQRASHTAAMPVSLHPSHPCIVFLAGPEAES